MDIKNKTMDDRQKLVFEENGEEIAFIVYRVSEGRMVLEHTEVDPAFNGQGLGKKLVKEAVEVARQMHYRIVPYCPYAKKVLQGNTEYSDVL